MRVSTVVRRVVRAVGRPAERARQAVRPGMQGLDEVQAIELGRTYIGPVTYGHQPEPVAELVVDRPDPLDEKTWTV